MSVRDHGAELTPTQARQGTGGRRLFWILTLSTTLAVVAVIGAWSLWGAQLTRVQGAAEAPAGQAAHFSIQPLAPRQS
jgi:hypothetical protein